MDAPGLAALERADHFAHLVLEGIQLLIPQGDVQALEPAADLRPPAAGHAGSVGRFELEGRTWPAYALSMDLLPLPERPESYRVAVLLRHGPQVYGVLCRQVALLERGRIALHPVPACMNRPASPLLALALCGEEVLCVSSARALDRAIREGAAP
jgi:hypothetical protein